jgi:hypothetical protein
MSDKKVDHEWKKKAREEKEQMAKGTPGDGPRLPEQVSIAQLISSLVVPALMALGEIENPMNGERTVDLDAAKFNIDLLQVLQEKTQGNLTDEESKVLNGALYDLRMRYVQAST